MVFFIFIFYSPVPEYRPLLYPRFVTRSRARTHYIFRVDESFSWHFFPPPHSIHIPSHPRSATVFYRYPVHREYSVIRYVIIFQKQTRSVYVKFVLSPIDIIYIYRTHTRVTYVHIEIEYFLPEKQSYTYIRFVGF